MELNFILLCFAVAVCTFALISKANPDWNPEQIFSKKKTYFIIAAALLAVAVFVRIWQFGAVPAGMNQDGAMAAVDAKALADYGTDRFGTKLPVYFLAWGYGQMSVLLSYCMAPFIKLFGLSSVTARLPMLLASLAGIFVSFKFVEKAFGKTPALIALMFIAINPWQIMQSRWALDCNLLPHFLLFSVYFLYLGIEKRRYLYLSMVFFALTMYSYGIAFYSIPLLLIMLCVYLLVKKRIRPWEAVVSAVVYLFFAWPIFAVVFINYFKLKTWSTGFITMQYFPDSIRLNDLIIYSKDFFKQLFSNIQSLTDMAILEKGDFNWNYINGYGQMYLFSLPFVLTGLWYLVRREKKDPSELALKGNAARKARAANAVRKENAELPGDKGEQAAAAGRFLLIAWLITSIFSGLMVNNVNTNRINIIFYPMCILAALGIWYVLFDALKIKKIAIALAVVYTIAFASFTVAYFGPHSQALAADFCSGLTDAVKYADTLDTDVLYITADSRSENAATCSEIYTLFGANIDARYFQDKAEAYSKSGKLLLPYQDRYKYVNFNDIALNQPVGSVFVFNQEELSLFDESEYTVKKFGNFSVAVKTAQIEEPTEPDDTGDTEGTDDSGDDGPVG